MGTPTRIWLIDNLASGSNNEEALRLLEETCGEAGFHVAHRTLFPRYDLPTQQMLDLAGVTVVAVFAGDGTINTVVNHLAGWSGAVLVLPGGTKNLLYHRLHGEQEMAEVIAHCAAGRARAMRPTIVHGPRWRALAGLMAGPGTSWNSVREAMRDAAILEVAGNAVQAVEETIAGTPVACIDPPLGKREGYPLILLNPSEKGIEVLAYHADTPAEFLEQSFALLKRNFREGPHDHLGTVSRVVLASTGGEPIGLMVDGEAAETEGPRVAFEPVACEVDLLTTKDIDATNG